MKKFNLFFSAVIFALVLFVVGGATIAPAVQMQSAVLNPAGTTGLKGSILFDSKGRYALDKPDLQVGLNYQFFGYDWRLVFVNGNVATFWMADPYTTTVFNQTTRAGLGIYKDGANIWTNGYSETIWKSSYTDNQEVSLGQSDIRKFLKSEANKIINNKKYASYRDKVIAAGNAVGNNQPNDTAHKLIEYLSFSKDGVDQVEKDVDTTNQLTAYYDLGSSDRLWLPSIEDLRLWNILDDDYKVVNANALRWTETTIANRAWLRDADYEGSQYARIISPVEEADGDSEPSYFHSRAVKQAAGVRPAIHLDITNISAEYQDHLDHPAGNGSWWNWDDDWLKALFMTVCVIGLVGLSLVVAAVIVKVRRGR